MNRPVSTPHVGPASVLHPPGDELATHVLGIGPDVLPDDVGSESLRRTAPTVPAVPLIAGRLCYAGSAAVPAPVPIGDVPTDVPVVGPPVVDVPVDGLPMVKLHSLLRTFNELRALVDTDIGLAAIVHAPPDDYDAIVAGLRSAGADAVHCEPPRGGNRIALDITVHVDHTPDA